MSPIQTSTTPSQRHRRFRPILLLLFSIFIIVIVLSIFLRLQAAVFARKASSIVSGLSTLRVGTTTRAEALSRIPTLKASGMGPYGAPLCNADECAETGIPNSALSDAVLLPIARTGNRTLVSILSWLGFRDWSLDTYVNFSSGKVSYLSYHMMVYTAHFEELGNPDVVMVEVSSKAHADAKDSASSPNDEDPFHVSPSRRSPSQSVGITFTPDAPSGLVTRAFDLKLRCLWSFAGCRTWNQLLPAVEDRSQ